MINSLENNELMTQVTNENVTRIPNQAIEEMKKKMNAELALFQERDYEWLWKYLDRTAKHGIGAYSRYKDKPHARKTKMAQIILVNKISLSNILDSNSAQVLNINYFDWIDQANRRQLIFINFIILKEDGRHRNNESLNYHDLFGRIIDTFDNTYWGERKDEKISKLNRFMNTWDTKRVPDKMIKWIDPNNFLQLDWAFNYLEERNLWIKDLRVDSAKKHLYTSILASLDSLSLESSPEALQLFMTKMSKTWSQKKFRDQGKTKNPYLIPLTKQAKKHMEELAERYGMKTNALLEMLISQEYGKEMLDENGKRKFK
jgi:hypothetical protein